MLLQPVLPFPFRFCPHCLRCRSHPCPSRRADLPALFWRGLCPHSPHFGPAGGGTKPRPCRKGHFLPAPALWNLRRGGPAAARHCFNFALKRLDLLLYRNQFSQLFNRQVLQWCHNFTQGASPPGRLSSQDATPFSRRAFSITAIMACHAALFFRRFFGADPSFRPKFRIAAKAPSPPASASNAACGSPAMRNIFSGVNFRGSFMDLRSFSRPRLMSMAEAPLFAGPTPIIHISINWMKQTPADIAGKVSAVPLEPCLLLSTWRVISPAAAGQVAGYARPVWNSTFATPALASPTFGLTLNHNVSFPFGFRGITRFALCYYGATPKILQPRPKMVAIAGIPSRIAKDTTMKNPPIPLAPATPKNKPVHQIRLGAVSASIWRQ